MYARRRGDVAVDPLVPDIRNRTSRQGDCLVDGVSTLGEHAVRVAHEAGVHRVAHPLEERVPIAIHVEQHDWFGDEPQLVPGQGLGKLVDGAEATR